ncbi:XamI family restriction endonuclease [Leisingera sp. M527]|uniref:XamI family restriction endonuclease n=1 Tax=Leisingera sp. M527 TaxID=2867014 RepID=UPI0021A8E5A6|nr:XamI family restriction endonuclease [Leisingera sp. M527]UWQ31304.1 XamI family restriction endonuclease [Leisingera sp. M527]
MSIISKENEENSRLAKRYYLENTDPVGEARDWGHAVGEIRDAAYAALEASNYLRDFEAALKVSGSHMLIFRHLLAPPKSQDQFSLLCPEWSKASEKSGNALKEEKALVTSQVLDIWKDRSIAPWLDEQRLPTQVEKALIVERIVSFIAPKLTETQKRNRLSNDQENAVIQLLKGLGWTQAKSFLIDELSLIKPRTFLHKARFATATTNAQEVDIACGLKQGIVAAMECKVTNDATNSVKRVNDILKKAKAWKDHWGSFVETAALLQGVIKPSDVQRLTDDGVMVFWSHDLNAFSDWVEGRNQ